MKVNSTIFLIKNIQNASNIPTSNSSINLFNIFLCEFGIIIYVQGGIADIFHL